MASNFYQNLTSCGLTTTTFKMPDAGSVFIDGKVSLPTLVMGGGVSACVVTITNVTTSTVVYTGVAGAEGFYKVFSVAANDSVSVAFTSAAAADQGFNVIKSVIAIGYGT